MLTKQTLNILHGMHALKLSRVAKHLPAMTLLLVLVCMSAPVSAAMSLKGLVEDEAGNPLNDITLHVRKSRFDIFSESLV